MARKLKTYQTSLGFLDQAIAAPSMKAALEAWSHINPAAGAATRSHTMKARCDPVGKFAEFDG